MVIKIYSSISKKHFFLWVSTVFYFINSQSKHISYTFSFYTFLKSFFFFLLHKLCFIKISHNNFFLKKFIYLSLFHRLSFRFRVLHAVLLSFCFAFRRRAARWRNPLTTFGSQDAFLHPVFCIYLFIYLFMNEWMNEWMKFKK